MARGANVAVDDRIGETGHLTCVDGARPAVEHHGQRCIETDQPRQALRPAGAGQQTKIDFGQSDPRTACRDAIVASGCELAPTAQRAAVERGDDGLARVGEALNDVGQMRRLRRQVELADIRAGAEALARACEHDRTHGLVGDCTVERRDESDAHVFRQRVDGRMVDRDQRDGAVSGKRHDRGIGRQR